MLRFVTFFDHPVKNKIGTYKNIRKTVTNQKNDYATRCLLGYPYFKENYKLIEMHLNRQQALNANPRAIHQTNFTGNLRCTERITIFYLLGEVKKTILDL